MKRIFLYLLFRERDREIFHHPSILNLNMSTTAFHFEQFFQRNIRATRDSLVNWSKKSTKRPKKWIVSQNKYVGEHWSVIYARSWKIVEHANYWPLLDKTKFQNGLKEIWKFNAPLFWSIMSIYYHISLNGKVYFNFAVFKAHIPNRIIGISCHFRFSFRKS